MSSDDITAYIDALDEPKRATLLQLRESILSVIPEAEQCISYAMPAFRLRGKVVAGFAAFSHHLSYLPHSGSVFPALSDQLASYTMTKGALHFPVDESLPQVLVEKLIQVRIAQAFGD